MDGSEDYTPASGSPLIEAGINASTIGAVTRPVDYPAVANVLDDDTVDGTAGTFANVAEADVEAGVTWGAAAEFIGVFVVPTEAQVELAVEFGAAAEFTGTFAGGGGGTHILQGTVVS